MIRIADGDRREDIQHILIQQDFYDTAGSQFFNGNRIVRSVIRSNYGTDGSGMLCPEPVIGLDIAEAGPSCQIPDNSPWQRIACKAADIIDGICICFKGRLIFVIEPFAVIGENCLRNAVSLVVREIVRFFVMDEDTMFKTIAELAFQTVQINDVIGIYPVTAIGTILFSDLKFQREIVEIGQINVAGMTG